MDLPRPHDILAGSVPALILEQNMFCRRQLLPYKVPATETEVMTGWSFHPVMILVPCIKWFTGGLGSSDERILGTVP